MATLGTLPAIDDCIEAYLTAHAAFGSDPFSAADVGDHVDGDEPSASEIEYRLTLLVAYGLLDRIDDDRYRIRCAPDESIAQWRERSAERAQTLHRLVTEPAADGRTAADDVDVELVTRDDAPFASVFVFEHDDAESVATTAASALARDESVAGIVLRASGARADHAQQIADQLCTPDIADRTPLERPFEKGLSDVVGESKDDLEFRLFLEIP
ncbi:hypothetical protein ACFO5R_13690 [Halosolutus amylolyticus]|uniref:Uncharacterized protein n=1 Tax=Halosolutus amylolyticus TaxID=2932267 RepID=A0ABD5PRP6_9EURY|nr:hypothetical protein [Halosolutus amylolyticus]